MRMAGSVYRAHAPVVTITSVLSSCAFFSDESIT